MAIFSYPASSRKNFFVTPITSDIDILKCGYLGGWHEVGSFKLSYASSDDIDLLVEHRQGMWLDIHPEFGKKIQDSEDLTRSWIRKQLSKGRLVGLIVKAPGGSVAGSGCIWIREDQPRPTSSHLEVPYLMSMYTVREFRRRGVAKLIVRGALKWCREHGYERIILHASKEGRPLYEGLGFEPSNEMRLKLWSPSSALSRGLGWRVHRAG
jgi:GNAT superfamily N-acetyltransferase